MGSNYCSCQDYKNHESKSEMHIESPKINLNSNINNINNLSYNDYSSRNDLDSNKSGQQDIYSSAKSIEILDKINLTQPPLQSRNNDKKSSNVLSLIKEKDQEDEMSEIESIKKNLIKYNNSNDVYFNRILINNNNCYNNDINIYKDNSFNIQYINDDKEINDNKPINTIKDIVYRNEFKKRSKSKNKFVYHKKFNTLNNFNYVGYNNFESNSNTMDAVPFYYKKVKIPTPKITGNKSKKKQNYNNNNY